MVDITFDIENVDLLTEKKEDGASVYKFTPHKDISHEDLINLLQQVYDTENQEGYNDVIFLNLKGLSVESLAEAFRYSLSREDLKNPSMLLNIINYIKSGTKLNDMFFEDENIYVSSIVDLLNLKLAIKKELDEFIRKLSIHFIALFKSYNKLSFTPLDTHIQLPNIYKNIFLASDILTLSGILSLSQNFELSDCVYIEDAYYILSELLMKSSIGISLMSDFLRNGNDNKDGTENSI